MHKRQKNGVQIFLPCYNDGGGYKKNVIVGYVFIIVFVNGEFIYKKNII